MRTAETVRRDSTTFVLLSFEGPDPYSRVGQLGERVTNLAETLARMGFETHLVFVGDPEAPGHEVTSQGKLHLHRWCQWISRYHPGGVYEAEGEKLWDYVGSAPSYVVTEIVKKSALTGKLVVVMGEEWHTAEAICRIADLVRIEGLEDRVVTLWNASDVRWFQRIDWPRLARSTSITTLSKYMKHVMWDLGVNALVVPNGIARRLLAKTDERKAAAIRKGFGGGLLLVKIADWDLSRRWRSAMAAVAQLKALDRQVTLIAAGGCADEGSGAYRNRIMDQARTLGLSVKEVEDPGEGFDRHLAALLDAVGADVILVKFPLSEEIVRLLFAAGDAVLADSDHEPFGQQALEAMAVGAVVFTGCTGEDYAEPLGNAIVLETGEPDEIVEYLLYLDHRKGEKERIKLAGRLTAQEHTWEEVIQNLNGKIEYLQRSKATRRRPFVRVPEVKLPVPSQLASPAVRRLLLGEMMSEAAPRPS